VSSGLLEHREVGLAAQVGRARHGMGVAVRHDHDVAGAQAHRRVVADPSPTEALGDHVVLEDVLGLGEHQARHPPSGRRLRHPRRRCLYPEEGRAGEPHRLEDVG
jgi:hypothetical protein